MGKHVTKYVRYTIFIPHMFGFFWSGFGSDDFAMLAESYFFARHIKIFRTPQRYRAFQNVESRPVFKYV